MRILLTPPVLFLFFLLLFALLMLYFKRYGAKGGEHPASPDPYACGQKDYQSYVNPEYRQFFRYAFVFTIMHVLALVVTTAPAGVSLMPLAYVATGVLALLIIFRK